jgi:hypothetical protein
MIAGGRSQANQGEGILLQKTDNLHVTRAKCETMRCIAVVRDQVEIATPDLKQNLDYIERAKG